MTKKIRIENADNSAFKVVVQIWDKYGVDQPDRLTREIELSHPTSMTGDDVFITSTRYIVIKEVQP